MTKDISEIPTVSLSFKMQELPEVFLAESDKGRSRFKMVVTSGKPIHNHFGPIGGDLVVDLSGVKFRQVLPALLNHDLSKRVGHTDTIAITKEGLVAEGFFLKTSEAAQAVLAEAKEGFPWEASAHLSDATIEHVGEDETASVNGMEINGPATIFRKSRMREVTFTAVGADEFTRAEALSRSGTTSVHIHKPETDMKKSEDNAADHVDVEAIKLAAKQEGHDAALKEERERVSLIYKTAMPSQTKLAHELVDSGATLPEAIEKLHADPLRNATAQLDELHDSAPNTVLSESNTPPKKDDFADINLGNIDAAWDKSEKLRKAYCNDKELCLSFLKNQTRIGGIKVDEDAEGVFI